MKSGDKDSSDSGFIIILDYTVDGPEQQRQLVDGLAELVKQWVRPHPGFLSAKFHSSTDGTRVINFVHWASEEDYHNFLENSDTDGRIAAIEQALANVSGTVVSPMDSTPNTSPSYTIHRTVTPELQKTDTGVPQ